MKKAHILAITLGAAVVAGTAFAAPGSDTNRQNFRSDSWLTIPAIYDSVTAAGYRDINEIEREKNGYEVKAVGPRGERVKLYVDPINGEVLDVRAKRDKGARRDRWEGPWADRVDGSRGRDGNDRYDRTGR